jgi:16S rRNA C1402 (ribose-2'-O) methylase RsmI
MTDPGEMARLLATEVRLDAMLRQAHQDAEALVAAAREAAAARDASLETELAAAADRQAEEITADRVRREAVIAVEAQASAARYTAIPPDQITRLSGVVVNRLLREEGA